VKKSQKEQTNLSFTQFQKISIPKRKYCKDLSYHILTASAQAAHCLSQSLCLCYIWYNLSIKCTAVQRLVSNVHLLSDHAHHKPH